MDLARRTSLSINQSPDFEAATLPPFCRIFSAATALLLIASLAGCSKANNEAGSGAHSVTISWNASSSPVVGYLVYRTSPPGGIYQKLTSEPISGTRYTDTSVRPGHRYGYYVTSLDAKKNESKPSDEISASVPGSDEPHDYRRDWVRFKSRVKKAIRSVR